MQIKENKSIAPDKSLLVIQTSLKIKLVQKDRPRTNIFKFPIHNYVRERVHFLFYTVLIPLV